MTIGQVASRAGVATSAVRYYERRGPLAADARQSGQRRFTPATLRRLVFIGMLQDAGLALDEIAGAHQTTVAAVALAWLLAQPTVAAPIASARTAAQLADLLPMATTTLTPEESTRLADTSRV